MTGIPSIVRAVINDDEDYVVGTSMAIAESFGLIPYHKVDVKSIGTDELMEFFSHRIRVYIGGCVFTYNESMETVEEGGCEGSVAGRIAEVAKSLLNSGPVT
ncbi:hypothetical protein [Vulcanisaeta souniana]|uniref:Uncharacterized protein n=1 Tax=Vulcanisaeta souniana JCM 11219 TaxID=1293586 RepID=A0A830E0V0_9CREN|nr:hypothetical protein [Vulcanisaeta souniana]GGI71553.1 hypothetical protein GCM10007112_05420 [Vulcanisaeta souniana JCM 11219]